MDYTYLLVFAYTKNGNSYFSNKIVTLKGPFSEDNVKIEETEAAISNGQKSRIIGIYQIERGNRSG